MDPICEQPCVCPEEDEQSSLLSTVEDTEVKKDLELDTDTGLTPFMSVISIALILERICLFLTPEEILTFFRALRKNRLGRQVFINSFGQIFDVYTRKVKAYPKPMTNSIFRYISPCFRGKRCQGQCSEKAKCYHRGYSPEMDMLHFEHNCHVKATKSDGTHFMSRYNVVRIWLAITIIEHFEAPLKQALEIFVKMVPKPFLMDAMITELTGEMSKVSFVKNLRTVIADTFRNAWLGNSFMVFLLGLDVDNEILNPHDFHLKKGFLTSEFRTKGSKSRIITNEKLVEYFFRTINNIKKVVLINDQSIAFEDVAVSALLAPTLLSQYTNISKHLFKKRPNSKGVTSELRFPIKFTRDFGASRRRADERLPFIRNKILPPVGLISHFQLHDGSMMIILQKIILSMCHMTLCCIEAPSKKFQRSKQRRIDVAWGLFEWDYPFMNHPDFASMMCTNFGSSQIDSSSIGKEIGYSDVCGECWCETEKTCQQIAKMEWKTKKFAERISKTVCKHLWIGCHEDYQSTSDEAEPDP